MYWRSNYGISLQKMIENYDLRQLNMIFPEARHKNLLLRTTCSLGVLNK